MNLKPSRIRIEASTACQLRCPACQTTRGTTGRTLGTGFLKASAFTRVLEENPWVKSVELSNWGEILLNPELLDIMRRAYDLGVTLHADNGVNFNTVRDDVLDGLARYRFASMTVALDGASAKSYGEYRKKGNFDQVIDNIRRLNAFKRSHGTMLPELTWQFVVFGHNEHEIATARSMAGELDMKFFVKLAWDESFDRSEVYSPVQDLDAVRRESGLGVSSRVEFHERFGDNYLQKTICSQLWNSPQVNWDGRVLGCCVNYWADFGNAFEEGLEAVLNNERMTYARQMLTGKVPSRPDIPCTTCPHYTRMAEDGRWLTRIAV